MAYTNEAFKNIDIFSDILNMKKTSSSILFENEQFLILTPAVQSNPKQGRFDIMEGNMKAVVENEKSGLIVIRYFDKLLLKDLKEVTNTFLHEKYSYSTSRGVKWEFRVIEQDEEYLLRIKGEDEIKLSLEQFNRQEFIEFMQLEFKHAVTKVVDVNSNNLITHIHNYITSKGFNYTSANIKNLYLSLRSKPFVIISGISGTGKTKIVQLFAESIGATEDNGQFALIPVRPDWSDGSELLGYTDIKGDFIEGPLTKVVREASDHLDRPYFVLLDEMNLARVEYYFSDVLSIMESRKKVGDTYTTSTLITIDEEKLSLPGNVYIIGTVNMDETTHPFSKKVLDRANTIEFNEIYLDSFAFLENPPKIEPVHLANSSIEASYVQIQDCFEGNEQIVKDVSTKLAKINAIIEPLNAHVGYRVRDEICFYMIHNSDGPLFDEQNALDFCIMQKILPRLAGSGLKIRKVLEQLFEHFTGDKYESEMDFDKTAALYPLSAKKVYDMLGRLGDEGFTSFWIS